MERTTIEGDAVHLGEVEFKSILHRLIRFYQFKNDNKLPAKIILPNITSVDNVPVELARKKKEAKDADAS